MQVDELFDENSNLEEENTGLVGRAERAEIQNAQLKEQLDEALAKVFVLADSCYSTWDERPPICLMHCTAMMPEAQSYSKSLQGMDFVKTLPWPL